MSLLKHQLLMLAVMGAVMPHIPDHRQEPCSRGPEPLSNPEKVERLGKAEKKRQRKAAQRARLAGEPK